MVQMELERVELEMVVVLVEEEVVRLFRTGITGAKDSGQEDRHCPSASTSPGHTRREPSSIIFSTIEQIQ